MNVVDIGIIAVLLVSGLLAFARGFVREVLAVAGWVGAAFAALYAFPYVQPVARQYIGIALVADVAAGLGVFVATLLLLSVASHAISVRVRESALGAVDRSLGFVFGLVRGAVIVSIAYLLLAWALPPGQQPAWLREARVMPLVERGGDLLLRLVPAATRRQGERAADDIGRTARPAAETARTLYRLTVPKGQDGEPDSDEQSGYKTEDRRALDNLIRGQQQ